MFIAGSKPSETAISVNMFTSLLRTKIKFLMLIIIIIVINYVKSSNTFRTNGKHSDYPVDVQILSRILVHGNIEERLDTNLPPFAISS